MDNSNANNLSDEEVKDQILKYQGMMKLSSAFLENAVLEGSPECHRYLYGLLAKEAALRNTKKINTRMKNSGIPAYFEKDDFDSSEVRFLDGYTYDELVELKFYEDKRNVFMYGNSGTGKTMLSIILGILLVRKGVKVSYYKTREFIRQLNEHFFKNDLNEWANGVKKRTDVLILDEFGYTPYDNKGSQLLFEFISDIYAQKSIILNTNQMFSQWGDVLNDSKLASFFAGRILENSIVLQFNGKDRRLKKPNP